MMKFYITDEYEKARGSIRRPTPRTIDKIFCAKNDMAVFQILCDADGKRCILNPGLSPALSYELGLLRLRVEVDAPFPCTVYAEDYLEDENSVACAEVLYEEPRTYGGGLYAPAFVKIDVPAEAAHGSYRIRVNIFAAVGANDETLSFSREITLLVYDFLMPNAQDRHCYLDLWQHNSNIARTYGTELWSDAHFSQIEKVLGTLADLGQRSITVVAGDCPWSGWGCYLLKDHPATLFEYSMVHIKKDEHGFTYRFDALRRYIDLCFSYGISGDITVYGLMGIWTNMPLFNGAKPEDHPERVLIRYFDQTDGCMKYMRSSKDILDYIRALFDFFRETGVMHLVRIGADEPSDLKAYEENVRLLCSIEPGIRFKMALDKTSAIQAYGEQCSDIAASFPCSCENKALLNEMKARDPEKRILWYICNIPDRPNSVLHSELYELTALGAIAYLFGFDGFLRWAYTCWTCDPTKDIRYNNTALPAGDVNFIYPAKNGDILYSIRYFALKRMLQTCECLHILQERGQKQKADSLIGMILRSTDIKGYMKDAFHTERGIFSEDPADYSAFFEALCQTLEKEDRSCSPMRSHF